MAPFLRIQNLQSPTDSEMALIALTKMVWDQNDISFYAGVCQCSPAIQYASEEKARCLMCGNVITLQRIPTLTEEMTRFIQWMIQPKNAD